MDLALNESQEMLRRTAREFLEANCPTTLVRELEASGEGYSPELWRRMAELGWLGLSLPAEYGGEGGDAVDQLVLSEEMGRALMPSPYMTSVVTCGRLVALAGRRDQREEMLPLLAQGKLILSLALDDYGDGSSAAGIRVDDDIRLWLRGSKAFVPYAEAVDRIICAAVSPVEASLGWSNILCVVPARAEGVTITPLESIGGYPQARVEFHDVEVTHEMILGEDMEGGVHLEPALEWATLVLCGEMVGRGRKILEMVIDYARNRVQFGRPIGAFQAIQHQLADLRVAVDAAELLTYRAACSMAEGVDCSEEIALAKASADEMSRMSTVVGHGVYAGISYTVEHDMQLYSARNRLAEAESGGTLVQIDRIAGMMRL